MKKSPINIKKKDREGSVYSRSKDPNYSDNYKISFDGNYLFNLNIPWYRKLWLFSDALVFGVIYIFMGLLFSWILNSFIFQPLDKSLQKWVIGFQIIGESVLNVLVLYSLIQIIPRVFPNIYPKPPGEHEYFKKFIGGILLSFGLLAAEYRLVEKVGYIFGAKSSLNEVLDEYRDCKDRGGFRCRS